MSEPTYEYDEEVMLRSIADFQRAQHATPATRQDSSEIFIGSRTLLREELHCDVQALAVHCPVCGAEEGQACWTRRFAMPRYESDAAVHPERLFALRAMLKEENPTGLVL